jgi:Stage II sporulation protein E (SpoIIE)
MPSQALQLLALTALAVLAAVGSVLRQTWIPLSVMVLVMLLGAFWLRMRSLLVLFVVVAAASTYTVARRLADPDLMPVAPGTLAVLVGTALLVLRFARQREELGIQGTAGEAMLVDLRERLRLQARVPPLPPAWRLEQELRPAYGDSFSGDFVVFSRSDGTLELALVDVSGKGQPAGTRSLMLSGALGGLLGAMPPSEFLAAANAHLLRQGWEEGFATAVHLAVDLAGGQYRLASAGHPPAAHYHAGSGRWELLEGVTGPPLGVVDDAEFPARIGRLLPGDALLLYTDGLVETPGRDLDLGIDRLMGQAERQVGQGFARGAARIVDGTGAGADDDRALVLLWRV